MDHAQPTHRQPPYCDDNGIRLIAELRERIEAFGSVYEDSEKLKKRIAELEAELRNWRDNYAGPDANVVPVPRYQIDRLLGE